MPAVEQELADVLGEDYPGYKFKRGWVVDVGGGHRRPADRFALRCPPPAPRPRPGARGRPPRLP